MKISKRYEPQGVIRALVDFAEGPNQTSTELKPLLQRVINADTGFVVIPVPDVTDVNVAGLRRELREFLRSSLQIKRGQQMPQAQVEVAVTAPGRGDILVTVDGSARDVLWFQIIRLMQLEGLDRIRLCECGRVFVRIGKRKSCSAKCQKKFYMRRFRAGEGGKDE
jgi:hypothetical protein